MNVDSNLHVTERELAKFSTTLEKVQESLTLPNPEYINATKFGKGRFYKKIDTHLCYLVKESSSVYCLPRYYFGEPKVMDAVVTGRKTKYSCGIKLRKYQEEFYSLNEDAIENSTGLLIEQPCGHGKCHGKGTKILMFDGSVKLVEDIVVGDLLMGDDSTPRKVLSLATGEEELFKIIQKNGEDYVVNRSHILSLRYRPWSGRCDKATKFEKDHYNEVFDMPLETYLASSKNFRNGHYGYNVPLEFSEKPLMLPPYLLGLWLGDGSSRTLSFTNHNNDRRLIHYYNEVASFYGLHIRKAQQWKKGVRTTKANTYHLTNGRSSIRQTSQLRDTFYYYNLFQNKHIPEDFLHNTRENRLQLLAGLIDTDGHVGVGTIEITQKRKELSEQIQHLCWTLGFRCKLVEKIVKGSSYWRCFISNYTEDIPTRLFRKQIPIRQINKDRNTTGISAESMGVGQYYGFVLDGNHRYCLHDGTVTHNTVFGIWLSHKRQVQTIVLVPTYFLAKQWVASIKRNTTATTHILSSSDKNIPVDNDFTIIVMDLFNLRTLPEKLTQNVGHVILDEAHRIGAESYLPVLSELPAMYRTALTATFRRADGVHRILKFHFGEHLKMKNQFPRPAIYAVRTGVEVPGVLTKNRPHEKLTAFMDKHGIEYKETKSSLVFKPNFQKLVENGLETGEINKTNFREISTGISRAASLQYTTVESYLNEHAGRRKIAVQIIQTALDSGRTILFLSKRKDVLKSLHKYFAKYRPMLIISETTERTPEEEQYLQEECRLIFGVTQLAKEGLDVERLDTLVIHLPIKDTEQAIGRISRLYPTKKPAVALYLLDACPMLYATFRNAKKFMDINGEFRGEINIRSVKGVL